MRCFFTLLPFFLFSINVCSGNIQPKEPPKAQDLDQFLNYSNGLIVLTDFSLKNTKASPSVNRVFKVSTSLLEKYGLKVGTLIQSVDFIKGIKNPDFILKDFVYAIWPPSTDESKQALNRLSIIPSYNEKDFDVLLKLKEFEIFATGIAYIGQGRKLYAGKEKLILARETPVSQIKFTYPHWDLNKKSSKVFSTNIFNNTLYVYYDPAELSGYIPLLKTPNNIFALTWNGQVLTEDLKFFKIVDWMNDEKILILGDVHARDYCTDLYFISKESVILVPLPCSDRNKL